MSSAKCMHKKIRFLHLNGDTPEEIRETIYIELENCFRHKAANYHSFEYAPYLDWSRISSSIWALIQKGKLMVEQGYAIGAIDIAFEICRRVSELYIEDEVWNNFDLDGNGLGTEYAFELLSLAINSYELTPIEIEYIKKSIEIIENMEATKGYGLVRFDKIRKLLISEHLTISRI